nr:ubiquitin carboxyl-terminal hydrolase 37-like isoform X2 [Paramormyrops kingsleyae]
MQKKTMLWRRRVTPSARTCLQQTHCPLQAETVVSETWEGQPVGHQYQLVGILSHLGSSATSGHYVSDTFSVEEKGWLSFSDHIVTRSDEEQVLRKRENSATCCSTHSRSPYTEDR